MRKYFMNTFLFSFLGLMLILPAYSQNTDSEIPSPLLSITSLEANTSPSRNSWSPLIAEELSKIGIEVDIEQVGWDVISPRTWKHPADGTTSGYGMGEIPTFDDGGYDILFVGLSGELDYNPLPILSSSTHSPIGDNFSHFANATVDSWLDDYFSDINPVKREPIAHHIQQALAYQLPYIPLFYSTSIWVYNDLITPSFMSDDDWMMLSITGLTDQWKNIGIGEQEVLKYAHPFELTVFSPFLISSAIECQYLNPVMPGLFERDGSDPNKSFKPLIAESNLWNTDNTKAIVKINSDAKFSNGGTVLAEDVVNTYRMYLTPAVGSPRYGILTEYLKPDSEGDYNNSIQAIGTDTVTFEFNKPYFNAASIMSFPLFDQTVIGTPDAPTSADYDFNSDPLKYSIGAGPFILDSFNLTENTVKIVKDPNYWNGEVKLDAIEFIRYDDSVSVLADLKSGQVHIIEPNLYFDKVDVDEITSFKTIPDFGTYFISVNMDHPILGTGKDTPLGQEDPSRSAEAANYIRLAISHMIDRDRIISEIRDGLGTPSTSLWPDASVGYDNNLEFHRYDIKKAKEYMELAGYVYKISLSGTPVNDYLLTCTTSFLLLIFIKHNKFRKFRH